MKGYIFTIISASVLGGIADILCPDGEGKGIKKALGFITALLMIYVLASPVIGLLDTIKEKNISDILKEQSVTYSEEKYKQAWLSSLENMTENETSDYISGLIEDKFDISANDFSVKTEVKILNEVASLKLVEIEIYSIVNPRTIEEYVNETFKTECRVYEKWGKNDGR